MIDFEYEGKNCVVTGAASGMGKATALILAEQGANVYAIDLKEPDYPVKKFVSMNLGSKDSIDAGVAMLPEKIDSIASCAGIAGTIYAGKQFDPVDVVKINFVGAQYLIESLIPRMDKGGAIAMIASIGGMNWARNMKDVIIPFIEKDYEDQIAFLENNRENPNVLWAEPGLNRPYGFSKECLIVYAKMKAWSLSAKGIRINTVSPGATATPMLGDFSRNSNLEPTEKNNLRAASPIGRAAVAEDQARAMVYINSVYAEYISGCDLVVDYGFSPGLVTGVASVSSVGALNR